MAALKDNGVLPMLLSTNSMVRRFPFFHCDKDNICLEDVMTKVKVLEDSANFYIKQNVQQM